MAMSSPYPSTQSLGETDLGFARVDTDRAARTGDPEVVFGAGKTPEQIVGVLRALREAHPDRRVLATRLAEPARRLCRAELPEAEVDDVGRTAVLGPARAGVGRVAVVAAGTSDLPVLRECVTTVEVYGAGAEPIVDVGVAGLHRLLARREQIASCDVVVAVAGMEAALASVVAGLVGTTVIAVPTSVGYGWHMDGLTAWLSVLNSCAPGVLTVNVDNGFGAGVAAARIARRIGGAAGGVAGAGLSVDGTARGGMSGAGMGMTLTGSCDSGTVQDEEGRS